MYTIRVSLQSKTAPTVEYDSGSDVLWTLVMTNPDGHLSDNNAEYVHWLV